LELKVGSISFSRGVDHCMYTAEVSKSPLCNMDEFAQSRGDDDLFEDDIIPIEVPEGQEQISTVVKQVQDISLHSAPKGPAASTPSYRGYGYRGDRGRGRGGRGRGLGKVNSEQTNNPLLQSKYAQPSTQSPSPPPPAGQSSVTQDEAPKPDDAASKATPAPSTTSEDQSTSTTAPAPPTEPSTPARPPAVRGDRTATGGIKKPKLTEAELSAKLAAAKTRSETLSAAHARAEADAASFVQRERAAAEKRLKDAANRKVMEGEREKNRARKMAVMGGREWDAEKDEEDFRQDSRGRGRGAYTRGANGGLRTNREREANDDLNQYQWKDGRGGGRGQGPRRGRGGERGAQRGRAENRNGAIRQPNVAAEADFPSLPANTRPRDDNTTAKRPKPETSSSEVLASTAGAGSWADQVEVSEAANVKAV
jgi:hypothetical protein